MKEAVSDKQPVEQLGEEVAHDTGVVVGDVDDPDHGRDQRAEQEEEVAVHLQVFQVVPRDVVEERADLRLHHVQLRTHGGLLSNIINVGNVVKISVKSFINYLGQYNTIQCLLCKIIKNI